MNNRIEGPLVRRMGALAVLSLCLGPLLVASVASASLAFAVGLKELTERADHIVLVRVVGQQSLRDAHGRIVTDVEVVVERTEKGTTKAGDSLLVRTLGGELDGVGSRVLGAASFALGERELLFAVDDPSGADVLHPLELSQGAMRVFEREGAPWVHGGGEGLALRKRGATGEMQAVQPPADRALDDVLADVRRYLAGSLP